VAGTVVVGGVLGGAAVVGEVVEAGGAAVVGGAGIVAGAATGAPVVAGRVVDPEVADAAVGAAGDVTVGGVDALAADGAVVGATVDVAAGGVAAGGVGVLLVDDAAVGPSGLPASRPMATATRIRSPPAKAVATRRKASGFCCANCVMAPTPGIWATRTAKAVRRRSTS
jgi:hypothetical protein